MAGLESEPAIFFGETTVGFGREAHIRRFSTELLPSGPGRHHMVSAGPTAIQLADAVFQPPPMARIRFTVARARSASSWTATRCCCNTLRSASITLRWLTEPSRYWICDSLA